MDYQRFVDGINVSCAVLSVAQEADGSCGEIRIVSRNAAMAAVMGDHFLPGMPYEEEGLRNMRFEEFCFRAAVRGQNIHDYSYVNAIGGWAEMMMIPLNPDEAGVHLCQLVLVPTKPAEATHLAKVSPEAGAAVIKACITLMGSDDFLTNVESVLEDALAVSGAWSCRIALVDNEKKTLQHLCERVRPDLTEEQKHMDLIHTWEETEGIMRTVIVTNKTELQVLKKHNPIWANRMLEYGLDSLLLIPLRRDQTTIGFFYLVNFSREKIVQIKEMAELVGFFLGMQISNRLLMDRLEEMSYTDALTGLRNRNAMMRRLRSIHQRQDVDGFGVVNLDLNGLKTVNDTAGHAAGDQFLIRAAEAFTKVFYSEDVFRTGGDEFIIVVSDISEDAFERKLERLRAAERKDPKISFSIGACWSKDADDSHTTFRTADERMYADKEAFYLAHPELRRK